MPSFLSLCQIPVWRSENEVIVVTLSKCFAPLSVDYMLTPTLSCAMTNHFVLVLFDCACYMNHASAANKHY